MSPDIAKLTEDLRQLSYGLTPDLESSRESLLRAAQQLVDRLSTPAERICHISWNDTTLLSAIRVLLDLGIFKILATSNEPKKATQLASASGADPKLVDRLLKHTATNGYVEETNADEYAANDMTHALASAGGEATITDCFKLLKVMHEFPSFLKDTKYANPIDNTHSAFQYAFQTEQHYFAYINSPGREDMAAAFKQHMEYKTLGLKWFEDKKVMQAIFDAEEFSRDDVIMVDIGGASGHDILNFKQAHSNLNGRLILQDLPAVINSLDTKALAAKGVEAMSHDMLTPQPVEYAKVYYLKMVLHDWPKDECRKALANLKPVLKAGYSRILLNEIVIPDRKAHWFETSVDMLMMVVHAAQERREWEWKQLIESVPGLKLTKIWDVQGALEKIIEIELA